jgi:hypothetical protein
VLAIAVKKVRRSFSYGDWSLGDTNVGPTVET